VDVDSLGRVVGRLKVLWGRVENYHASVEVIKNVVVYVKVFGAVDDSTGFGSSSIAHCRHPFLKSRGKHCGQREIQIDGLVLKYSLLFERIVVEAYKFCCPDLLLWQTNVTSCRTIVSSVTTRPLPIAWRMSNGNWRSVSGASS